MMVSIGTEDRAVVPVLKEIRADMRPSSLASRTSEYSRFVHIAKILLPSAAVGLLLVIVLYSALHSSLSNVNVSFGDVKALGGELEMSNPTLTYTDDQNRAFFVNARRATQKTTQQASRDLWHLEDVRGRMAPPTGRGYKVTSDTGQLDASKKLLDLAGRVLVVSDEGYTFEARSAHVDMGDNRVRSEEPVRAHGGATTIDSDRFEMWDRERGCALRDASNS
jgi:hypothetical protein